MGEAASALQAWSADVCLCTCAAAHFGNLPSLPGCLLCILVQVQLLQLCSAAAHSRHQVVLKLVEGTLLICLQLRPAAGLLLEDEVRGRQFASRSSSGSPHVFAEGRCSKGLGQIFPTASGQECKTCLQDSVYSGTPS